MFISRTTRDISQIPGVNTFSSFIKQDRPPEGQKISMAPCSSCKKVFDFPQCTPWREIERIIEEHRLGCDKKRYDLLTGSYSRTRTSPDHCLYRATASANAKKRWAKEKQRHLAAHLEPPQTAHIGIKQKRRARADENLAKTSKTSAKNCRTLPERKVQLEEDPWTVTKTLDPKHVDRIACGNGNGSKKRRLYYPRLWFKHKERCAGHFVRAEIMVSYLFIARVLVVLLTSSFSLLGWQLRIRLIIRRRFMLQVNPLHKALHDPDA